MNQFNELKRFIEQNLNNFDNDFLIDLEIMIENELMSRTDEKHF